VREVGDSGAGKLFSELSGLAAQGLSNAKEVLN
jgi:hypothetical protein